MQFPLSLDLLMRLPRHPDWRYELIEGEALLTPRPQPLGFRRSTDAALPAAPACEADVRAVETSGDRVGIIALLTEVWSDEDPYRSFEEDARDEELRRVVERSVERPDELDGAVAVDGRGLCACALVTPAAPPTLSWLTVRRDLRGRGLATALLGVVVDALAARGEPVLASFASAANVPSLRWHLACGFELAPDPLREALRRDG